MSKAEIPDPAPKPQRRRFLTADLSEAEVEEIAASRMDPRHNHLDELLDRSDAQLVAGETVPIVPAMRRLRQSIEALEATRPENPLSCTAGEGGTREAGG